MIRAGVNPAETCDASDGQTALCIAAEFGQLEMVKLLVSNGAPTGTSVSPAETTDLWLASAKGRTDVVDFLLSLSTSQLNKKDSNGRSPYAIAKINKHEECARLLLKKGAIH